MAVGADAEDDADAAAVPLNRRSAAANHAGLTVMAPVRNNGDHSCMIGTNMCIRDE